MLHLFLTTLLALQSASASPGLAPGGATQPQTSPTAGGESSPQASPTPAPAPRRSPTPLPKVPANFLLVVNKSDNTVSILDGVSGKLQATVPVEPGPHEVELLADGRTAAVSSYGRTREPGRTVSLIDVATGMVVAKIDIGENSRPHGLKALRDGRLLVTAEGTRELAIVDPRSGRVSSRIPTGRDVSHMVAASPDGRRAYVTSLSSGSLTVIDLVTGKVVKDLPTGKGAEGVDASPNGSEIWVTNRGANTISVIDAKSLAVVATIPASSFPIRVKFTPDGSRAVVTFTGSGDVGVFDAASRAETRRIAIGRDAVAGSTSRTFQNRFGTSPDPVGLLIAGDGRRAFVSATHADVVAVVDLEKLRVEDAWVAGREPDGLAGKFVPKALATGPRPARRVTMRRPE